VLPSHTATHNNYRLHYLNIIIQKGAIICYLNVLPYRRATGQSNSDGFRLATGLVSNAMLTFKFCDRKERKESCSWNEFRLKLAMTNTGRSVYHNLHQVFHTKVVTTIRILVTCNR
jgi:hypothetical protein